MDGLLAKVTQQAMNYAIRSGIAITSGYALQQCSRLMKTQDSKEREELGTLQRRLEGKIRIISPAIDMIELIAARGNTSLESAVSLTKAIRWDIQKLGVKLAKAASVAETLRRGSTKPTLKAESDVELKVILSEMKTLLDRIEDAVPLINLAITTSGVSLSTNLPATISPSRLLQASTFLSAGDAQYVRDCADFTQIGPTFTLSMYMLFSGHSRLIPEEDGLRTTTWKEVIHKTQVKLVRVPLTHIHEFPLFARNKTEESVGSDQESEARNNSSQRFPARGRGDEFAYQISIIEDLNDDRVHSFGDEEVQPGPLNDLALAGLREVLPVHEVSKIFYADTGKILNIGSDGETNNPVLLLKRDVHATPPRRMMEAYDNDGYCDHDDNENNDNNYDSPSNNNGNDNLVKEDDKHTDDDTHLQAQFAREALESPESKHAPDPTSDVWRLPSGLDPEWLAFEVYGEAPESDSDYGSEDEEAISSSSKPSSSQESDLDCSSAMANLHLGSSLLTPGKLEHNSRSRSVLPSNTASMSFAAGGSIRTSLSLLEMLVRLTSLQQFQQCSHLAITDELLNFFLEESSTTGAAPGDTDTRKRIRLEARQRVGFDPYDESPIKRRGEAHQSYAQDYDQGYADAVINTSSILPSREHTSRQSTPLRLGNSPLRSRSGTPERLLFRSSPSLLGKTPLSGQINHKETSLGTPPGTTKSRQAFLRDEKTAQRSSLANSASELSGDDA